MPERDSIFENPPAHSPENESALVSSAMIDPRVMDLPDVAGIKDSDFVGDVERVTWREVKAMRIEGVAIDAVTLYPRLAKHRHGNGEQIVSSGALAKLINAAPNAAHALHYANNVKDASKRRRNWAVFIKGVQDSHNGKIPDVAAKEAIEQLEGEAPKVAPGIRGAGTMVDEFDKLRPPVIEGILREGETLNVIAAPKMGKSWLTNDLALCAATGRDWLGFPTVKGRILIVDNELHCETSAHRIQAVANARMIRLEEYQDQIDFCNLRGRLMDINRLGVELFDRIKPGDYKLIGIDALYRVLPPGVSENDNAHMAAIYNQIDAHAMRIGCGFFLIHHSSKGSQAGKAVTDIGAGAGAQSRATDTHLVLRPHEQEGCVVVDAAVRSWKPLAPFCLRWNFPVFDLADELDPAAVKPDRPPRKKVDEEKARAWVWGTFAKAYVSDTYKSRDEIQADAQAGDPPLSERKIDQLLKQAVAKKAVYRHASPGSAPVFSTNPVAPETQGEGGGHTPPRTPCAESRTATTQGSRKVRKTPRRKAGAK